MFYIVGHQFKVQMATQKKLMQSRSVTQQLNVLKTQQNKFDDSSGEIEGMKKNNLYEIIRIKNIDNGIRYTFKLEGSDQKTTKDFNSTKEADEFIARISGETEKLKTMRNSALATFRQSSI